MRYAISLGAGSDVFDETRLGFSGAFAGFSDARGESTTAAVVGEGDETHCD